MLPVSKIHLEKNYVAGCVPKVEDTGSVQQPLGGAA